MDVDELYEEQRIKELDFIEEFFIWKYGIVVPRMKISTLMNYKKGDSYVIEYRLKPNNVVLKLDISRDIYDKVNSFVRGRDIDTLSFEEIDNRMER